MIINVHITNNVLIDYIIEKYKINIIQYTNQIFYYRYPNKLENINIFLYINKYIKTNKVVKNKLELILTNNLFLTNYKSYYGNEVLIDPCYFYDLLIKELILTIVINKLNKLINKLKELYTYKYNIVKLIKSDFDKLDLEDYKKTNSLICKYNIKYNKLVQFYTNFI